MKEPSLTLRVGILLSTWWRSVRSVEISRMRNGEWGRKITEADAATKGANDVPFVPDGGWLLPHHLWQEGGGPFCTINANKRSVTFTISENLESLPQNRLYVLRGNELAPKAHGMGGNVPHRARQFSVGWVQPTSRHRLAFGGLHPPYKEMGRCRMAACKCRLVRLAATA